MELFREVLHECCLFNIGYVGSWFTRERGNLSGNNIRERLDRGVANKKWLSKFSSAKVKHLTFATSDHFPLLL